jgi:superfamily I DNA/RNA helicase
MSNFAPFAPQYPELAEIGRVAETAFIEDPRAAMSHLRLFGEKLAIQLLDDHHLHIYQESQLDRLRRLRAAVDLDRGALDSLHALRREGNKAVHAFGDASHGGAMSMLKASHRLVRWYWERYTPRRPPPPGPFRRPEAADPREDLAVDRAALEAEKAERSRAEGELERVLRLMEMPQVATHHAIEAAYQQLSPADQVAASALLEAFRAEPIHEDWPLEKPDGMDDGKVRFVRSGGLVVTVIQPERGDLLLVVHVGSEAEARAWAAHKRFEVNPSIGTLQVFDVVEAEATASSFDGGLLDEVDDDVLLAVGLPKALLPAVRAVSNEDELDALAPHLPPEASDGIYLLASGHDLDEALTELDRARLPDEVVDTDDFAAAVHHPESKRSFLVVDAPEDLRAVLTGSVEAWRLYLHPDQRRLVRMRANGPVRVLGGAGTGKTVALLHRANHLTSSVFVDDTDRLLVTTFTRNLAADLSDQLDQLLGPEDRRRVDVHNLHAFAASLWEAHGDGRRLAVSAQVDRAWTEALRDEELGLSESFYRAEWERVVQAQDLSDEVAYLRARRAGRGVRLSLQKRKAAWKVFVAYRDALDGRRLAESADQFRVLRLGFEDGSVPRRHVSVLADEVQDFGAPELRFLRALVAPGRNDLFLVGDAHQRIYGYAIRMGRCGIEIRGRSRRLRVNYRTTARVRAFAVGALTGQRFDDLDGGTDSLDGYRSLRVGTEPEVHLAATGDEERALVVRTIQGWLETAPSEALCVAAPTNRLVEGLASALQDEGIDVTVIESDASAQGHGVRCATFHRLKGLEFPRLVLSGVQEGLMPLRVRAYHELNEEDRKVWDLRQRCLLYVAASRARDELVVTGWGGTSPFLTREPAAGERAERAEEKRCPKCGKTGSIEADFGLRRMRRTLADGTEVVQTRPQSYCRECRGAGRRPSV